MSLFINCIKHTHPSDYKYDKRNKEMTRVNYIYKDDPDFFRVLNQLDQRQKGIS